MFPRAPAPLKSRDTRRGRHHGAFTLQHRVVSLQRSHCRPHASCNGGPRQKQTASPHLSFKLHSFLLGLNRVRDATHPCLSMGGRSARMTCIMTHRKTPPMLLSPDLQNAAHDAPSEPSPRGPSGPVALWPCVPSTFDSHSISSAPITAVLLGCIPPISAVADLGGHEPRPNPHTQVDLDLLN